MSAIDYTIITVFMVPNYHLFYDSKLTLKLIIIFVMLNVQYHLPI